MTELLKAVMAYRPPAKLHRIGKLLIELFEAGDGHFDDAALARLREELARCGDDLKELSDANCALLGFINLASGPWNKPEAAAAISVLLKETFPRYTGLFDALALEVAQLPQDIANEAKRVFERLVGPVESDLGRAPTFGEKNPVTSVPLRKLLAPAVSPGLAATPRRPPAGLRPGARLTRAKAQRG